MITQHHKLLFVALVLGDLVLALLWLLPESPQRLTIVVPAQATNESRSSGADAIVRAHERSAAAAPSPSSSTSMNSRGARSINAPAARRTRAPVALSNRVRLQGTVMGLSGHPLILSELEIDATSATGEVFSAQPNLRPDYLLPNLHAGQWTISAHAEHCYDLELSIDLRADEPVHQLDLVLQDEDELRIRWLTPDAQPLSQALDAADLRVKLMAVATAETPSNPLPAEIARDLPISNQHYRELSAAKRTHRAAPRGDEKSGNRSPAVEHPVAENVGVLTRDGDSLAFVSAVLGDRVLRTERVAAAQPEMTFTIGVDEVRASLASIHMTIIDATSGEPIANASVTIDDKTSKSNENGSVEIDQVVAGARSISIFAPRYKNLRREEQILAGRRNELGQYSLVPLTSARH
jgi:hypothetical protein